MQTSAGTIHLFLGRVSCWNDKQISNRLSPIQKWKENGRWGNVPKPLSRVDPRNEKLFSAKPSKVTIFVVLIFVALELRFLD